jgi:hypothetical protein
MNGNLLQKKKKNRQVLIFLKLFPLMNPLYRLWEIPCVYIDLFRSIPCVYWSIVDENLGEFCSVALDQWVAPSMYRCSLKE